MMTKKRWHSVLFVLGIILLLMMILSGCREVSDVSANSTVTTTAEVTLSSNDSSINNTADKSTARSTEAPAETQKNVTQELDVTQRNSIGMLNYLTVLTQEINASKNSRLYLEEVYSSLINNTYPNAVDSRTLSHLNGILDTLESYRMTSVKRDRLLYVYEQNRAQALRAALPNPLGLMSSVQSFSLIKLVASITYMAVDSYNSYTTHTTQADLQYLQDGWSLNDAEATTLHNSRKDTFSYMVRIVGDYDLPGDLALSEKAVDEFVEWKNKSNVVQRIQFLESNREIYQALGVYWLVLAESYYANGNFSECIDAVSYYESLDTRIFRKDTELAKILPLAILSAGEITNDAEYVRKAEQYSEKILANIENTEWALRYFAAQTFVELYAKTNDSRYLTKAYDISLDNVNYLVSKQRSMNVEYTSEVMEIPIPKDATKEARTEIENYNKQVREERKTALPPIYEPLLLNCDLLFSLGRKLNIANIEKEKIDGILHEDGEYIFLIPSIDALYRYSLNVNQDGSGSINDISFTGKEISIPAKFVSGNAVIKVTVTNPNSSTPRFLEDWEIKEVIRKDKDDFNSFVVIFKSTTAEKINYNVDDKIQIEITPKRDNDAEILTFSFEAVNTKDQSWEKVKFWNSGIAFQRAE